MSEEERGLDSFAPAEDTAGTDTADAAGIGADTAQAQKTPSSGLASLYDWVEMAAASLIWCGAGVRLCVPDHGGGRQLDDPDAAPQGPGDSVGAVLYPEGPGILW